MADPVWLQKELEKADTDKAYGEIVRSRAEFSPANVSADVGQMRGDDAARAAWGSLRSLPSTVPKISPETRNVYNKYSRFLNFAGASGGDYTGAKSFQAGISSALDMDMIQDLLEEQRSTSLSTQFGNMLPYFNDLPDVARFATSVNANLAEREDLGQIFKNSRPDVAYRNEILQFQDKFKDMNTDEAITEFIALAGPLQLPPAQIIAAANNAVSGLKIDKHKGAAFVKGIKDYVDFNVVQGGEAGKFNFNHILPYNDKISEAFATLGMEKGRHYNVRKGDGHGAQEHIHINPKYMHDIDTRNVTNMNALRELEVHGITPYKASLTGTSYRMMQGDQPEGTPFLDSNQPMMEMATKWQQAAPDRFIVKDMGFSDIISTRGQLEGEAARDAKRMQASHARGIAGFAGLGLKALEAGGGPGASRAQFLMTHVNEMAKDWGELAGLYQGGKEPSPTELLAGLVESNTNSIQELMALKQGDATEDDFEKAQDVFKSWAEDNDELSNQVAALGEDRINRFAQTDSYANIKDQYSAQILLGLVEAAIQAQVARMYIDKDRMLASFYNAIKERINLTGWMGTNREAEATLKGLQSQANYRAAVAESLLKPRGGSGFQQDLISGDISYPQAQQQQPQTGVPPIQDLDIDTLSEEQLNILFQKLQSRGG